MVRANAEREAWAVARAELDPGAGVLVVEHGPGLGLAEAASAVTTGGHVLGIDPSPLMRDTAARRCAQQIAEGLVEVRDGTAERTGWPASSVDAAIPVNDVMLWDRAAAFAELSRVLRPSGRLVITASTRVFDVPPGRLGDEARAAGFGDVSVTVTARSCSCPATELLARRPG